MQLESLDFQIQCRTSRASRQDGTISEATIFSAFVVSANNTWLQVELNNEKSGVHIYIGTDKEKENSADYTLDYYRFGNEFGVTSVPGLDVRRDGNTTIAVFTESGKILRNKNAHTSKVQLLSPLNIMNNSFQCTCIWFLLIRQNCY